MVGSPMGSYWQMLTPLEVKPLTQGFEKHGSPRSQSAEQAVGAPQIL